MLVTYKNVRFGVGKGQPRALPKGLLLAVHPVIFANVLLQAPSVDTLLSAVPSVTLSQDLHSSNVPNSQSPLLIGQPSRRPRKVGQNKGAGTGHDDGGDALNDKQPLPRAEPACPVHPVGHACRDEAGESAGDQGARVQDGGSEAEFLAGVPTREVVQTSRAVRVRCQRPGRRVGGRGTVCVRLTSTRPRRHPERSGWPEDPRRWCRQLSAPR